MANTKNCVKIKCDRCGLMYRGHWRLQDGIYCYACYQKELKERRSEVAFD
jgi:hypothetical protein